MITCAKCKKLGKTCGSCKEYGRKYSKAHRSEMNEYSNVYYYKNKEWIRAKAQEKRALEGEKYMNWRRRPRLKRVYGITQDQFNEMLSAQGGLCKICRNEFNEMLRPCVDHCHKTGRVRGLLCRKCNLILGQIEKNNIEIALISQYLK